MGWARRESQTRLERLPLNRRKRRQMFLHRPQKISDCRERQYGLGFDPVANVLWAYDDDTKELISIQ